NLGEGPRRIMLLLDTSGSLRNGNGQAIGLQVIQDFIDSAIGSDQLGFVDFNDQVYLDIQLTSVASFAEKLKDPVLQTKIMPRGGTALFDAISSSAAYMQRTHQEGDSILVISDGDDNASHASVKAMADIISSSNTRIYVILLAVPRDSPAGKARRDLIDHAVKAGG